MCNMEPNYTKDIVHYSATIYNYGSLVNLCHCFHATTMVMLLYVYMCVVNLQQNLYFTD